VSVPFLYNVLKGVGIGVALNKAACAAAPSDSDWATHFDCEVDPRAVLYKEMGIAWSEDNFWRAVERGDTRAVSLFLKDADMKISGVRLHKVLRDPVLAQRAPLDILAAKSPGRHAEFCSSDDEAGPLAPPPQEHRAAVRFAMYAGNNVVADFVSKFCNGRDIVAPLRHHLRSAETEIATLTDRNKQSTQKRDACVRALLPRTVMQRLFPDPSKQSGPVYNPDGSYRIRSGCENRHDVENAFEAKFCTWVFDDKKVRQDFIWPQTVKRFCAKQHAVATIDTSKRELLRRALQRFDEWSPDRSVKPN
jgi:hypothetical protein